jgi:hypothetical protein
MNTLRLISIATICLLCASCVSDQTQSDEFRTTTQDLSSAEEYFHVRQDFRRCVAPLCGGIWIDRINKKRTRCPDGTKAPECYIGGSDFSGLGLSATDKATLRTALNSGQAVMRGYVRSTVHPSFGDLGTFEASEAWTAATDQAPTGKVYNVKSTGIVCAAAPCPSWEGAMVNRKRIRSLAGVDLSGVGATADQINDATSAMSSEGILAAGSLYKIKGPAGKMKGLRASQFYLQLLPSAACVVTGCSSHICAESSVISTCEWKTEYGCYRDATCETQSTGKCGWTQTTELLACIAAAQSTLR